jgi:hypothetical protein
VKRGELEQKDREDREGVGSKNILILPDLLIFLFSPKMTKIRGGLTTLGRSIAAAAESGFIGPE